MKAVGRARSSRASTTSAQTASAVATSRSVDPMLLEDGTYFVLEAGGEIVACGGWSRRDKLYTGCGDADDDARLLDPATEPARVRAMFVRGDWTRRGLGRADPRGVRGGRARRGLPAAGADGDAARACRSTSAYGFRLIERRRRSRSPDGVVARRRGDGPTDQLAARDRPPTSAGASPGSLAETDPRRADPDRDGELAGRLAASSISQCASGSRYFARYASWTSERRDRAGRSPPPPPRSGRGRRTGPTGGGTRRAASGRGSAASACRACCRRRSSPRRAGTR